MVMINLSEITKSLGGKDYLMISAAIITGLIHLYVGYTSDFNTLILAGLGFVAGTALFLTKKFQNIVVAVAVPYTAVQFLFYYQSYGFNLGPLAAVDKIVQLVFIVVALLFLFDNYQKAEDLAEMIRK